jgi:hypothetical protein
MHPAERILPINRGLFFETNDIVPCLMRDRLLPKVPILRHKVLRLRSNYELAPLFFCRRLIVMICQ